MHILIRKNVQTAGNVQRNVRKRLFCRFGEQYETIFEEGHIRRDRQIHKRYKVGKMGDYWNNHLFCVIKKDGRRSLSACEGYRVSMSVLRTDKSRTEAAGDGFCRGMAASSFYLGSSIFVRSVCPGPVYSWQDRHGEAEKAFDNLYFCNACVLRLPDVQIFSGSSAYELLQ